MKNILLFKNTDDYGYFGNYEVREKLTTLIKEMNRDNKTYMITIEEVNEINLEGLN